MSANRNHGFISVIEYTFQQLTEQENVGFIVRRSGTSTHTAARKRLGSFWAAPAGSTADQFRSSAGRPVKSCPRCLGIGAADAERNRVRSPLQRCRAFVQDILLRGWRAKLARDRQCRMEQRFWATRSTGLATRSQSGRARKGGPRAAWRTQRGVTQRRYGNVFVDWRILYRQRTGRLKSSTC